MRKYIIIILLLFGFNNMIGQSSSDIGKIALSVIKPDNIDGLDDSQLSKLETKIFHIVSTNGLAASGYNNNFVIYPKFAIYESNVVEGGMQKITVVSCELSLFIKQVDNNTMFSTISKSIKGSGNDINSAISNSISKIPVNNHQFSEFIQTGKDKIVAYYDSKCQDIISQSENLVKMQDYEQAIGLLMTVPEEVGCYNNVQNKSIEAYKAYQLQHCYEQLQRAKTQLSSNNYIATLNILSRIDPSTPCFEETEKIAKQASMKVDLEDKKQWDLKMKIYNDNVEMDKQRIEAIKAISVTYYKTRPSTVSYSYLLR